MAEYSYDRVALHESQDIADECETAFNNTPTFVPQLSPAPPAYSPDENRLSPDEKRRDSSDRASLNSFSTFASTSTSSGFEKLKHGLGLHKIRRKPVSIREERHTYETEYARIGRGLWKDQLLVDRSLRTMALMTCLFALALLIVIVTNAKAFAKRPNKQSTSVGGEAQNCKAVARTNTALLLLINVAATMVLGMSNTYQQLVTSLNIRDLKFMLRTFGDSRVGTNSPFNINHKQQGKRKAWAAWLLLICTSLPVHFLANSLLGPSFVMTPPAEVTYNETTYENMRYGFNSNGGLMLSSYASFPCYSAFRTGISHFSANLTTLKEDDDTLFGAGSGTSGLAYKQIVVNYAKGNCTEDLRNSTTDVARLEGEYTFTEYGAMIFGSGQCNMGESLYCIMYELVPAQCRLNVRMQAAFVLAGCLILKATYMVTVTLLARGKVKRQILTFGDAVVASTSDPDLKVEGECMVNASDNFRRHYTHACHKHCKNPEASATGDEIGHCQKCKKHNSVNRHAQLPQPTIATKIKKSLVANLGNTALTQMIILMICGMAMMMASIAVAVIAGGKYSGDKRYCKEYDNNEAWCNRSSTAQFELETGGWGGMNKSLSIASLPPDRMSSEFITFCISNGAQFIYSLLYLMLIYNISLICQERDWGMLETGRRKLRCTLVKGASFYQDYLLQLPKYVLGPVMIYSILTHWMLGEALQTQESVWSDPHYPNQVVEHSKYSIVFAAYPLWLATFLIVVMTGTCWWAYTYKREGFIPQMFGSIRVCCAATTELDDFPSYGIQWGDLGQGKQFRHAGLSAKMVNRIEPNELYAGRGGEDQNRLRRRRRTDGDGNGNGTESG